jgi:hypothetical protein
MMGTLASAGSLKFDCLTKTGAQLQSWLFSRGTAFCGRNKIRINLDKLGVKNILSKIKNNMDRRIVIHTSVHIQGDGLTLASSIVKMWITNFQPP